MSEKRDRGYLRKQRIRVIRKKKRIIHEQGDYWYVDHDGILSKGKIHCSCPMCRHKSYDHANMQDLRKKESCMISLSEFGEEKLISKLNSRIRD